MNATQFDQVIHLLCDNNVDFVLIGGLAANLHGSARVTYDLDVVYSRELDNLKRIVEAFAAIRPYLRGAPPGLPFRWDIETLRRGLNFTFDTSLGPIDILGEATGGGTYPNLIRTALRVRAYDRDIWCASLDALIDMKTSAGRPKDFESVAELQALRVHQKHPLDEP